MHHGVISAWRQRERELLARGLEIVLLSARRWDEGGRTVSMEEAGDRFVIPARTWGSHPSVFGYDPVAVWRAVGRGWDLIDLHEEPNALATAEVVALARLRDRLARRPPTPYVLYSAQNIEKRYPVPFRWIERWSLRHAAGAWVCNRAAGQILVRKGLRGPVRLIPLGVDVEAFRPAPDGVRTDGPLRIGYVGRFLAHKGVDVLLDALAGVSDAELTLYGAGPEEQRLRDQVAALGLGDRVRFAGHLGSDALPEAYRELDLVVIPSRPTRRWLEQFCRVAVEAMASGVPIVASRSGAIPDVVGDAGVLVESGDVAGLRDALRALADPARRTELRAAGLARSAQFSWSAVAEQHRQFYADVLAGVAEPEPAADQPPWVLVIAYGSAELLRDSVGPLDRRFPVLVVDNSSLPETAALAAELGADYVDAGSNLGFAAGVNRGLAEIAARGGADRDVLLLNPDARIEPDAVDQLQRLLHADPDLACIAPEQTNPNTGEAERVRWPFPSPVAAWLTAVGLGRLHDRLRTRHGFVIGSILLLRAAAVTAVGPFDERFFLYSEETDWQRRAVDAGWQLGYAPQVHGEHVGAGTGGSSAVRLNHFHRSLVAYMGKHHGTAGATAFQLAMLAGSAARAVLTRGATRRDARERLAVYRTSWRGR